MKNLSLLLEEVNHIDHRVWQGVSIKDIQYDSRKVTLGDLFVAIVGYEHDGHQYIQQALDQGAIAIMISDEQYCSNDYPWILVEDSRKALAELSSAYYDHPSKKLVLIGVTGTNGKTTTTNLICRIIEDQGFATGLIGTIHNRVGQTIIPVSRTTPESLELQKLLAEMVDQGIQYAVMEVSSHALELSRVAECQFDIAVFTNLTQDHLDHHGSMENYCKAKTKLFTMLGAGSDKGLSKTAVVNLDDPWAGEFLVASNVPLVTYGIEKEASWKAEHINIAASGADFQVDDVLVRLKLTGKFNVYNALAALATTTSLGFALEAVIASLEAVEGVPGRFQSVEGAVGYSVLVDYAHTPDGLENVIVTAREFAQGHVITLFGCGGDRDRTKRPLMGEVAGRLSHFCIVTSDNPRTEDPQQIIDDILPGIKSVMDEARFLVNIDRKTAIHMAIAMARPGDVIILAGKGHEDYQDIGGVKHHFDDYEIAQQAISERNAD